MCRFESGFFFKHELLKPYDYYWRVEPGIKLFCDVDYDPFLFMKDNNKKYGNSGPICFKTMVANLIIFRIYSLTQGVRGHYCHAMEDNQGLH